MHRLKSEMELISGLNFTVEHSKDNKLPFLNVLVENLGTNFKTSVYRKPTDIGACMNAMGDAPSQYKISVIKGYLHRAKSLCTSKEDMLLEIQRAKQILVNNGYLNKDIDAEINSFLRNNVPTNTIPPKTTHKLFYRNYMNRYYRKDEIALRCIIKDNVKVKNVEDSIQLIIYYKTRKTRDLFMKNNLGPKVRDLAKTHAVYEYRCQLDACKHLPKYKTAYDGLTTCTISRRLSNHLQKGAILEHCLSVHHKKISRKDLENAITIRYIENDYNRLSILESLIIYEEDPELNRQDTGKRRTLKLYGTNSSPRFIQNQ